LRVLVTGGGGFIGSNLVRRLEGQGDEVVAIDDFSTGDRRNLDGTTPHIVEGSILDRVAVDRALDGCEAIVHLAARPSVARSVADPLATHHSNATGTLEVLEGARRHGVSHVIVASSSSVYGSNPHLPKREDLVPMPASPYAVSKLATEWYSLAYQTCYGLDVLALRFFNVYGPRQRAGHAYAAVIPAFASAALAGEELTVHGDGNQTRDFTFVGSVEALITRALRDRLHDPLPVNLAFGTRTSLLQLIERLERIMGRPLPRRHVEPRTGDVRDSQADNHRLGELVPDLTPTSLDEGLAATVSWLAQEIGLEPTDSR
jgi:UDP-glucose 4-epimerase